MQFLAGLVRENRDIEGIKETVGEDDRGKERLCFQSVNDKASLLHVIGLSLKHGPWPSLFFLWASLG